MTDADVEQHSAVFVEHALNPEPRHPAQHSTAQHSVIGAGTSVAPGGNFDSCVGATAARLIEARKAARADQTRGGSSGINLRSSTSPSWVGRGGPRSEGGRHREQIDGNSDRTFYHCSIFMMVAGGRNVRTDPHRSVVAKCVAPRENDIIAAAKSNFSTGSTLTLSQAPLRVNNPFIIPPQEGMISIIENVVPRLCAQSGNAVYNK